MLRGKATVEQSRQEDGVVGDGQRHGQTDQKVRDNDDRDLLRVGQCAIPADDTSSGRRSESGDQRQQNGGRDGGQARRFDADEEVRDPNASGNRHCGVDPPEHIGGLAPATAPFADDGQGDHLDDDGEGDGDAGEAGGLDDAAGQGGHDLFRVDGETKEVGGEHGEQQGNGVDPENVGDDLEAAELVVELVQDEGDDAGALGDEEPL